MSGAALALVLVAAVSHAFWNALTKRARDPLVFVWSSVSLATVMLVVPALATLHAGELNAGAPFLLASIALHAFYFYALSSSYGAGDFSRVYPIARGLGVALVPVVAYAVFGERLSPLGVLGIALVVAGIVAINLVGRAMPAGRWRLGPGTGWALLTGLTITAYSVNDKAGVGHLHPVPYIALMGVGTVLLLTPTVLRRPGALRREWAVNWRAIVLASTTNLTSYLLVLFAFRLSKAGYVVAARELSILFSALIGSLWLGEGRLGPLLGAAVVVLAGVVCVALAR
ncbi:MAG: EamA family transporter [Candidatus Rokubacteria bacterium]|nr:EamA family transporter [Candidatus Rokubacteria bacterium]